MTTSYHVTICWRRHWDSQMNIARVTPIKSCVISFRINQAVQRHSTYCACHYNIIIIICCPCAAPQKKKTHRKKHSQDITNVHGSLMVSMTVPVRPPNGTYTHFVVEISRLVGGFIYLFQPPKRDDDPLWLYLMCFRWIETTNQMIFAPRSSSWGWKDWKDRSVPWWIVGG